MMNSISERESLPVRCRVVCDGISRYVAVLSATGSAGALPSLRTLCRSHRDSNRAPGYRWPLRGLSGSGFDDQFWPTDALSPAILWESPHPLSIVGVT